MSEDRPFPLHTGVATVVETRMVTPSMRRFTLSAPAFANFGVEQPGEIITLGWPNNGEMLVMPDLGWRFPRHAPEQHWRNFTVRRHDRARESLDVDIFLHGDLGRAAGWGLRAQTGDTVGFAGPRVHWVPDNAANWTLLVADETGLPALLAIAESLPSSHRVFALAEVADERERQQPDSAADISWHWVLRAARAPGTTRLLVDAARELRLPGRPGQAWGGGEALAIRDVRRYLTAHCPALAGSIDLLGYWKHRATPDDVE